ncbi:lasso peptide biosynthesis B2 protein [Sphingomonas faeni]|uniref:lasso peptide biosynthesis B2 protein n=1 Tax=Sphingomonas faeni TaxID=185950 RepID=UPI00278998A6|nr:lasso peptide biosynthesis B2 protein [Sphingomonas faeni]MDQ0839215.1 hypothetical protein [Sphingomonas faeni]
MIALSDLVYGVAIGTDLILLDVRADRYHALVGAIAAQDASMPEDVSEPAYIPEAAATLIDAGLMFEGAGRGLSRMHEPVRALLDPGHAPGGRPRIRECVDLLVAGATAWWRLRRGMPCRTHHSARPRSRTAGHVETMAAVEALERLKLFIPTPRRCLPASLIASLFLARRGVQAQIVFGVRSHPFEAHCWVEYDGMVLCDDIDRVSAYRPIVVGQP